MQGKESEYIGKRYQNTQGLWLEVIEYKKNNDVTVRFDIDGTIKEHCNMTNIRQRNCPHPNKMILRIGERYQNTQGLWYEVIKWDGYDNVTVKFDNGTIKEDCRYQDIEKGICPYPNNAYLPRIGERHQNTQGLWYEIIKWNTYEDISVKFDIDGTIKEHCRYQSILKNICPHPNRSLIRAGERYQNKKGLWYEIVEYKHSLDVSIKFDIDGTIKEHCRYIDVRRGDCSSPRKVKAKK